MRILIAEDDYTSRIMLKHILNHSGHEVVEANDGGEAMAILQQPDAPRLGILDWMMPEMDGIEVCREIRRLQPMNPPYLIILTVKNSNFDIVTGFQAGANDYISKPYNNEELFARIDAGCRVLDLQQTLADRIKELEAAQKHINILHKFLTICSHCHKIHTEQASWEMLEKYLTDYSDIQLSHGICPECMAKYYPEADQESNPASSRRGN